MLKITIFLPYFEQIFPPACSSDAMLMKLVTKVHCLIIAATIVYTFWNIAAKFIYDW